MALAMIVSGNLVASDKLAGTALFDRLTASGEDLLAAAIDHARQVADARPLPKVRDRFGIVVEHGGEVFSRHFREPCSSAPISSPMATRPCSMVVIDASGQSSPASRVRKASRNGRAFCSMMRADMPPAAISAKTMCPARLPPTPNLRVNLT